MSRDGNGGRGGVRRERLAASKARGATEVDTRRAQAAEAERQARIAMVQAKAAQVLAGADGSTEAATSRAGRAAAPQGAASAKPRLSFCRPLTVPTETAAAGRGEGGGGEGGGGTAWRWLLEARSSGKAVAIRDS